MVREHLHIVRSVLSKISRIKHDVLELNQFLAERLKTRKKFQAPMVCVSLHSFGRSTVVEYLGYIIVLLKS